MQPATRRNLVVAGLLILVAPLLSRAVFRLETVLDARLAGAYFHRFPEENSVYLVCLATAVTTWAWASGVVLGAHSKPYAWRPEVVFYLVVMNFWTMRALSYSYLPADIPWMTLVSLRLVPLRISEILFAVPAVLAIRRGWRQPVPDRKSRVLEGAMMAFLCVFVTWLAGPRGIPWQTHPLALILLTLPAAYFLAAGVVRRRFARNGDSVVD